MGRMFDSALTRLRSRPAQGALSDDQFRAIFDRCRFGMAIADERGRYVAVNEAFERLVGYTAEELEVQTWMDLTHQDDIARNLELHALEGSRSERFRLEKRYVAKDGNLVWVDLSVAMLPPDADGRRLTFAVAADITERKRLEGQLVHAQKMEAVGRLAGGVEHDFNNLLTAIIGYSALAAERLEAGENPYDEVGEIHAAAVRASALTNQLLAFSRKQVLRPALIDMNSIVTRAARLLERVIGEDVRVDVQLAGGIGSVRVDPSQLEQVIVNLAVNARDAMPEGGTLTIETGEMELGALETPLEVELEPGSYVVLLVRDTGTGMDEATRSRIFEPFFTTKEPDRGTGLGLSTVYGVVTQSGGHIEVESEPGKGTEFRILLPRVDSTPDVEAAFHVTRPPVGVRTILLIVDDAVVREHLRLALGRYGYLVLEAGSHAEAYGVAARHEGEIDLVLSDQSSLGNGGTSNGAALGRVPRLAVDSLRPDEVAARARDVLAGSV
jgi:two-component system, cell cycle sensor histidine kinase and response regulator CckA